MRTTVQAAMLVVSSLLFAFPTWAGEVRVYIDQDIRPALLECLDRAQESVDIEMYALTDAEVLEALQHAESRGVEVRVILDPNQIGNQDHVERLTEQGVEVKWFPVKRPAQMHRKLAIIDGHTVLAGSVNWTGNGLGRNEELLLVIEDHDVTRQLAETFDEDWSQSWVGHEGTYHRRR